MNRERRKVPLVYVPYNVLPYDQAALCQNPEFVTGRKDSLCIPWGEKCKILHCWAPKGEKESDWLRSEVHYLVEVEPTPTRGPCSSKYWKNFWSRYVYEMSEDTELYPIIHVISKEHLNSLHGKY
jgi:hypothetical protein